MNDAPAVETEGLRRTFDDVVAVDSLDLRVDSGTFFGFLGPNGAGKSTTLKMLTGVLPYTSGSTGVTVFLTSHILEIVEKLCDHIAIIDGGRLVASGTLEELQKEGGGSPDGRTLEELFIALVSSEEQSNQGLSWLE
jgi:ABC-type multidrug transport system ATPase subunit